MQGLFLEGTARAKFVNELRSESIRTAIEEAITESPSSTFVIREVAEHFLLQNLDLTILEELPSDFAICLFNGIRDKVHTTAKSQKTIREDETLDKYASLGDKAGAEWKETAILSLSEVDSHIAVLAKIVQTSIEEKVTAHELTHVHTHTHPKYYEGPELRPFPVTHSHNHAHTLNCEGTQ